MRNRGLSSQRGLELRRPRKTRAYVWLSASSMLVLGCAEASAQTATPAEGTVGLAAPASPQLTTEPPAARINSSGRNIDLVVPLRDRFPLGQVAIRITPQDEVFVSAGDVATALSRAATKEFVSRLQTLPALDGYVALTALRELGLAITLDPSTLELVSNLDVSARPVQNLSMGFATQGRPPAPDQSGPFSVFLAYQATLDWAHKGFRTGLRAPRIDMRLDGRIRGAVAFENELTYDGDAAHEFTRFGSRLIYDRPDWDIRFKAGDQISTPVGFQTASDVLGFGAQRLLGTFHSDRIFTARSGRSLTLREPATVTIAINGIPSRTVMLGPGNYDIGDLPLTGGANAVELIIEDAAGGRRVVAFDFFSDVELLAPGIDEGDLQIGVRSDFEDGVREYYTDEPILAGFYRRGITEQFTAGVNAQLTRDAQMVGAEASLGTPVGLFTVEAAGSNIQGFGWGQALRLQYRYSTPLQQLQGIRRIDVSLEYRSRDFGTPDTPIPLNPISWQLSARYSQPITPYFTAGIGLDYAMRRGDQGDRYAVRADMTWRPFYGATLTGFVGYERERGANFGVRFLYRFGRGSTLAASYDSRSDEAILVYSHTPDRILDTLAYAAQINRTPEDIGVNGTAVYRTNRGDFELAHRTLYSADRKAIVDQTTSLRARGTFAFAGGQFATGRYLSDAFAIISGHRSLNGAQIEVGNRLTGQVEARTGALGPALVALSSYNYRNIYFDVPDAPPGYDFGAGNLEVYPWLHSGFDLQVGSEFNVTVSGTLLDELGEPVALVAGLARRLDDPATPTVTIFTNRVGRLGASGLAPGRWRIKAAGRIYEIEIREDQGSYVNLQELRPSGREENSQ